MAVSQQQKPIKTRAALAFLLSDKGNFFREFILDEIVKAIDAISREQLARISAAFGIGSVAPVFSMVPLKPASLITEEDEVILNNVEKVLKFLTAGTSTMTNNQDVNISYIIQELLPVLPGISAKVLPEVTSRLASRILARLLRDTFL